MAHIAQITEDELAELEEIRKADSRGLLKPPLVVQAARDPKSPLHSRFEWNDSLAAQQHRLAQARDLIRVVVTVLPGTDEEVQCYVSLRSNRNQDGGYMPIAVAMKRKSTRDALLAEALDDLHVWQGKYKLVKELSPVFAAARSVSAKHKISAKHKK